MLPAWVNKMQRNQTGQDFLKIFLFEVFLFGIEVRMKLYYSLVTVIFALRDIHSRTVFKFDFMPNLKVILATVTRVSVTVSLSSSEGSLNKIINIKKRWSFFT